MRTTLCVRVAGQVYRILWMSESKKGIYVGVFNNLVDSHMSYHQDGTRHWRVAKVYHNRWKDVPLSLHVGIKQLNHSSISILPECFQYWSKHVPIRRNETVIVLDEHQFYGHDTLAVDVWLTDVASETVLLKRLAQTISDSPAFVVIAELIFGLENYENQKLAIMLRAARITDAANDDLLSRPQR